MEKKLDDNTEVHDNLFKLIARHPDYRVKLCEELLHKRNLNSYDVEVVPSSGALAYGMEDAVCLLCKKQTFLVVEVCTYYPNNFPTRVLLYIHKLYEYYSSTHCVDVVHDARHLLPDIVPYLVCPLDSRVYPDRIRLNTYFSFHNYGVKMEAGVLHRGRVGSSVVEDYMRVWDLISEGLSKGIPESDIGEWVKKRCIDLNLFSSLINDSSYDVVKEFETMCKVKEIMALGRREGQKETLSKALGAFSKKFGIPYIEAQNIYEEFDRKCREEELAKIGKQESCMKRIYEEGLFDV